MSLQRWGNSLDGFTPKIQSHVWRSAIFRGMPWFQNGRDSSWLSAMAPICWPNWAVSRIWWLVKQWTSHRFDLVLASFRHVLFQLCMSFLKFGAFSFWVQIKWSNMPCWKHSNEEHDKAKRRPMYAGEEITVVCNIEKNKHVTGDKLTSPKCWRSIWFTPSTSQRISGNKLHWVFLNQCSLIPGMMLGVVECVSWLGFSPWN